MRVVDCSRLESVAVADIPEAIGELEAAKAALQARLFAALLPTVPKAKPAASLAPIGRRLRAEAVAELLGRSTGWVYKNARELPGHIQAGPRCRMWWDERALRDWLAKGSPMVAA